MKGKEQGQQDNFLKYFGKTGFNTYRTLFCKISWGVKSTEKTKEKVIRLLAKTAPMQQKGKTDKKIPAGATESSPVAINTGKSGRKIKVSEIFLNQCKRQGMSKQGQSQNRQA